ncbi:ribosome small subunit-dependent GTPase A [Methylibium sp.]|uniref:ribosome small subunit-dependent GTPase A n=1 Tax=Methylibium sp. TaxID=2067992 RepID=UPI002DBD7DCA|nr:ribosome small subunit-dependent GTPase A [Methylibium sp.]
MFDFDFDALRRIGWNDRLADALATAFTCCDAAAAASLRLLRLTEVHRDRLVADDGHASFGVRALPAFERTLRFEDAVLAVGDWVLARKDAHRNAWIEARLAPRRAITRRDADGRRHAIVSHVDTALFVMGLDADFNPRRIERYLLLAPPGVQPVVVLTKADLVAPDPQVREAMVADERDALLARLGGGLPVVSVDATSPSAALVLAPWLEPGHTLVLLGSSGAGKSTLTNALLARREQDTGAVRVRDLRGQHTTTARSLHRLPGGACVIDTPGLRALRPDVDADTLARSFDDIDRLAPRCRFRDCTHDREPGCAVRDGVDADRLRNFHKLRRELGRDTMTALDRRRRAEWAFSGRQGAERARAKRGER